MRKHYLAILVAFAAVCVTGAQEPPPVSFKTEVNYVEIGAIVTDAQGRFVPTLTRDDFQIIEDGRPQKVAGFSLIDIPVHSTDRTNSRQPGETDVSTNAAGFQGRLYLVVLDDLHTELTRTSLVKAAARRFIEQNIADNDVAMIATTSGRIEGVQDFTSNRRLLLAAVDAFTGLKLRSAVLEKLDAHQRQVDLTGQDLGLLGKPVNDAYDRERGQRARNTLILLKNLADSLSNVHGRRKAMVYISEGIDYTTNNFEEWREIGGNARTGLNIEEALRDAVTAASRANVSIYSIDPRGLTNFADAGMELNYVPDNPNLRLDNTGLLQEVRNAQDNLRILSEQTGGIVSVNANDLNAAFDRVVRDNSSYYMLGYYPNRAQRDGRFRRLEVRMSKPGLQVRARKGYVVPRENTTRPPGRAAAEGSVELADALSRPIQTSDLKLHVNATAFKGTAANPLVGVVLTVDGEGFTFAEKDGWIEDKLEVSVRAVDSKATIRGSEHFDLNIRIRPENRTILMNTGFRVVSKVEIPPGKYRLQIGVRESGRGAVGTVFTDIDVPDLVTPVLAISGIAVTSVDAGGVPTGRGEQLSDRLPFLPLTTRTFAASDEMSIYAEVYDNDTASPHTVDVTMSILGEGQTAIARHQQPRSSTEFASDGGRFRYAARIPLKELKPGAYVVRIEAASRLDRATSVAREVHFRLR